MVQELCGMKTPVVFIIFNRADTARRVFEEIRRARPPRLFVIADGPRPARDGERQQCLETRAVIEGVDWECELTTDFSDLNLGCRNRIATGLDRVFAEVEEAIILEDDCLPDPSFFGFCEALLARYRDDRRVMHIGGSNYLGGRFPERISPFSYYFSRYNHCWGWATWRRAWANYDAEMSHWSELRDRDGLTDILTGDESAVSYWKRAFDEVAAGRIDSWSLVWTFSCWINSGLTILPAVNLISNIGFDQRGTHTRNRHSRFANMPTSSIPLPLVDPWFVIRNREADRFTQRNNFQDGPLFRSLRRMLTLYRLLRRRR
jgi:hypothetical protein